MKNPTQDQRAAIESLQRNGAAWSLLQDWLRESHQAALDECSRAESVDAVRRLQGEAACLREIIGTLKPKQ